MYVYVGPRGTALAFESATIRMLEPWFISSERALTVPVDVSEFSIVERSTSPVTVQERQVGSMTVDNVIASSLAKLARRLVVDVSKH